MRLNKYLARATGISRRGIDDLISQGKVEVNDKPANLGLQVSEADDIRISGKQIEPLLSHTTIMLNKPIGYVCSREGQGSKTIYELLPIEFKKLKSIGRLDKDSSGLILLTDDGDFANQMLHPTQRKEKVYEIELNKSLSKEHQEAISKTGVSIGDERPSKFKMTGKDKIWTARLQEGRNRQIRRTFEALGYIVVKLHRTKFGNFELKNTKTSDWTKV